MDRPSSSFWDDLNRELQDPKFRRGYVKASRKIQKYDAKMNLRLQHGTWWQCMKKKINRRNR